VKALHLVAMNDMYIQQQFLKLLQEDTYLLNGLHPSIVAKRLNIALIVAKEQLLLAEENGVLCRDECVEGLYFFKNMFKLFSI
jgi:hypothetical protein